MKNKAMKEIDKALQKAFREEARRTGCRAYIERCERVERIMKKEARLGAPRP